MSCWTASTWEGSGWFHPRHPRGHPQKKASVTADVEWLRGELEPAEAYLLLLTTWQRALCEGKSGRWTVSSTDIPTSSNVVLVDHWNIRAEGARRAHRLAKPSSGITALEPAFLENY